MLQKQPTALIIFVPYEKEETQFKYDYIHTLYHLDDHTADTYAHSGRAWQNMCSLVFAICHG